jgi:hypothetical protein
LHQGETRGYGKKFCGRDNPQPSPKVGNYYGCSSETQCRWTHHKDGHKIESVPMETWFERGTNTCCDPSLRESFQGHIHNHVYAG